MRFIDLFAGLGGFHIALKELGHECVFACEKNDKLAELYEKNFGIPVHSDIKELKAEDIPEHDILCAGFPCQPFSKAGYQNGLSDNSNGSLFYEVTRILEHHMPQYFILENVPNLKKHDREKTWRTISDKLEKSLGYKIDEAVLSPHEFGIPQIRNRLFIIGSKSSLDHFKFPKASVDNKMNISKILEKKPKNPEYLTQRQRDCLELWQEIIDQIPKDQKLPSFPIWAMEFGATYPYDEKTPHKCTVKELGKYKGIFGKSLEGSRRKEQYKHLPSYAKRKEKKFPNWKIRFIKQNREFFEEHKEEIRPFLSKLKKYPPSWQKFEWNCHDEERVISKYIIQFRGSGIRVKRSNYSPSLVAATTTQRPILGWESRYLSINEAAKLQSLDSIKMPDNEILAYKALGNAVNAKVVSNVCSNLVPNGRAHVLGSKHRFNNISGFFRIFKDITLP